jgi:polar amino acid transport system substrate-binding protein
MYRKSTFRTVAVLAAAVLVAAVATTVASAAGSVTTPPAIKKAGKIVFCSDMTYPPEEFLVGPNPQGSDIDIGNAIAKLMGVKAQFQNTGFDGIIAALLGKRCDAVISGMNDTPERRKQISFADYLAVGMSFMVKKGNPPHVNGPASLSGKTVAVEVGTTEKDYLAALNKTLKKQGKKQVTIQVFNKDTDAATALVTGKVDVYFADSPPVAYYIKKSGGKFQFAGKPIEVTPVGIAVRHKDPLLGAFHQAIKTLYSNGQMAAILKKWQMSPFGIKVK